MTRTIFRSLFAALLGCWLFPISSAADEPRVYSGLTRPGTPSDSSDGIRLAVDDEHLRKTGLGGTIYYQVLTRHETAKQPWGVGLKDFATTFKPGLDFNGVSSPPLDRSAEYLYLYQVVNDRQTLAPLHSVAVPLLVEQREITSWGYFSGVGFAVSGQEKEGETKILPVSFGNIVSGEPGDRLYRAKAPALAAPKPYQLTLIPTKRGEQAPVAKGDQRIVNVQWNALDPAVNPDHVMLLGQADKQQRPTFRAIWRGDNLVKKEGRSTVFGFTSQRPPQLQAVRLFGEVQQVGRIVPAAQPGQEPEQGPGQEASADGRAPTPRPARPLPAEEPTPLPEMGSPRPQALASPVGASSSGGGGGGGAGLFEKPDTGSGGGSPGQDEGQQQSQKQDASQGIHILNGNPQSQNQHQKQKRDDGCDGPPPSVVPAPAALLLAGLGLPILLFLRRRRK